MQLHHLVVFSAGFSESLSGREAGLPSPGSHLSQPLKALATWHVVKTMAKDTHKVV